MAQIAGSRRLAPQKIEEISGPFAGETPALLMSINRYSLTRYDVPKVFLLCLHEGEFLFLQLPATFGEHYEGWLSALVLYAPPPRYHQGI